MPDTRGTGPVRCFEPPSKGRTNGQCLGWIDTFSVLLISATRTGLFGHYVK